MIIECNYHSGEKTKLNINSDNYLLPVPLHLEISETNKDNLYVNGLSVESHIIPYNGGEDCLIECGRYKCRIIALNGRQPENFKIDYNVFALALRNNYVGDAIDEETLFLAIADEDKNYGLSLCTFNRQIDSVKEDTKIGDIHKHIRYLPNIFYRPRIHLKSNSEIIPIDIVTRIGHEAIKHLASHSEHWEARKANGLIPARLLAKTLEDDYAIYENIVAKCLVDKLYSYAINKRDNLKNVSLQIPSEESFISYSEEQKGYFKAREALLKGYSSENIQYVNLLLEDQIKQINEIISKLLECKDTFLYRKLRHCKKIVGELKATNIFMLDNNYKYVYKLWKLFLHEEYDSGKIELSDITGEYENYCQTLFIFALNHFNFKNIDGENSNIFEGEKFVGGDYSFKDWNIKVKSAIVQELGVSGILATISTKMEKEIDCRGIALPEEKDVIGADYIRIDNEKLIFNKKPNDSEINDFCNLIRKKTNIDKNKEKHKLMKKIKDSFIGVENKEKKILFIPLSFKFVDSSIVMQKCVDIMNKCLERHIKVSDVSAYYYLTPFRPIDYSEKETFGQLKYNLSYGYANDYIKHNRNKIAFGVLPITVNDINSYRRFTKVLLMQMVDLNSEIKNCPICGEQMITRENEHYCRNCSMEIFQTQCNSCKENFIFSGYPLPKTNTIIGDSLNLEVLIKENSEGFKNITDIDSEGKPICPYCGKSQ